MTQSPGDRLEQYTLAHPDEVFLVQAEVAGEPDEVIIFRGFSSSLMQPTAYDLEVPVLPQGAKIQRVDHLRGPYDPRNPQPIQENLSWPQTHAFLISQGF
ncbi:DUF7734 family protein [Lyngbya confervoides]|uniref:DUF7734 domain-containing protein n=1 Tax=Lyngbya confervoides BDU141951 TaxID=1574623 RepID=A0ABD4T8V4_9CYAN|nr:hypothetical protein [Lyngbya confervoides]MCM1985239.1 hypothetical protein [Lyngbya confervoides BDU141951]